MDLTNYAALNVKITEYTKVNNQFSLGRARVFYEGPNVNRTIINPDVAKNLIKTIPGTPIVGRFNSENDDFEGHGEGQIAYGFVPLEPNPLKVEVTEDYYGLPIKRTYYEVDAVIWDGRFPEAKKILGEEKSLSMELNPDTLDGDFEIYDEKTYLKITNAEFYGITVLGDGHTPCFKDAKFLQTYASMVGAYEAAMKEQESNIGGKDMPNAEEKVAEVEVTETDATITNEETPVETEVTETEEVVETPEVEETVETEEAAEETPTEDGIEEGTEEESEAEETESEEEYSSKKEDSEEEEEEENNEDCEHSCGKKKKQYEDSEESTEEVEEAEEEPAESEEPEVEGESEVEPVVEPETTPEVETEEESEAESEEETKKDEVEEVDDDIETLKSKLKAYESAAKEELINKFAGKINDVDFMNEVKENIGSYSVEDLKATLGAKLADQVVEEEANEEKANGLIYSFNGLAKKETKKGWQELVRATKAANKNK